jgi:hypothetical protein
MSDLSSSTGDIDGAGAPTPTPPTPASRWEDFIDIFYAPSTVFARRAESGFGIPMLVVTLALGILFLVNAGVLQPLMDAEMARSMAKNPNMTPEMMEKGRAIGMTIGKVAAFVFTPVMIFCVGLALWLCGKMVDAKESLAAALMVTAYAYVPKILEAVLGGVQGLLMDPASLNGRYRITLGVGRFFDPETTSPLLLAVVGRIDLFTIWVTVLLAIGLAVVGKIPRSRAAIAAVLVWVIGMLPGLLQGLKS